MSGHMGMRADLYPGEKSSSSWPELTKVWAVSDVGFTTEVAQSEMDLGGLGFAGMCGGKDGAKDCFRIELNTAALVGIFGHAALSKQDQMDYVLSRDPETDIEGKWRSENRFQQSLTLSSKTTIVFMLSKLTRGVFPDIKSTLNQVMLHMTGVPKGVSGIPRGFFLWFNGAGSASFVTEAIVAPLLEPFAHLIDAIFGKHATREMIKALTGSLGDDTTKVGLTFNEITVFGVYLKLPMRNCFRGSRPSTCWPGSR
jgi:hypothetical protein